MQLGGFAFIGEGIPIGLGAAFQVRYRKVRNSRLAKVFNKSRQHACMPAQHVYVVQDALKDDSANQVCCSFFGDGTANNGKAAVP